MNRGDALDNLNSLKYRLLELIGISGEFPADQLSRLVSSPSYREKLITELKTTKLIKTHYRDKLRGYRLTPKSKQLLLSNNPERFGFYLTGNTETNQIRSEVTRRMRLHQKAEAYLTLMLANISIFPDDKPALFSSECETETFDLGNSPLFYSSREIKALGTITTKIKNSRAVGVFLTESCAYMIYNTGDHLLKWEYRTEIRISAFMQQHLQENPYSKRPPIKAIMLGHDMSTAKLLMTSTGGYKRSLFMLDTTYEHFYYVPNNEEGSILIRILGSPALQTQLNLLLLSDMFPKENETFEHDTLNTKGEPVLLAYDFDMMRINKFNAALSIFEKKGTLICFDFQKPVLQSVLNSNVSYSSIDFHKFRSPAKKCQ